MTKKTFKEIYSQVDPFRNPDLDLYEEYNIVTQEQLQDVFTEQEVNSYLQNNVIIELDVTNKAAKRFRLVSKAVRRKMAIRMKKLAKSAAFKMKVARSKLRIASPEKIKVKAAKVAKQKVEQSSIAIRNIRRSIIDEIKSDEKNSSISQDESKRMQQDVQKVTDTFISDMNTAGENKQQDILSI